MPTLAELAAVYAMLGNISTAEEYRAILVEKIKSVENDLDQYLNFNKIKWFQDRNRVISKEPEALLI